HHRAGVLPGSGADQQGRRFGAAGGSADPGRRRGRQPAHSGSDRRPWRSNRTVPRTMIPAVRAFEACRLVEDGTAGAELLAEPSAADGSVRPESLLAGSHPGWAQLFSATTWKRGATAAAGDRPAGSVWR